MRGMKLKSMTKEILLIRTRQALVQCNPCGVIGKLEPASPLFDSSSLPMETPADDSALARDVQYNKKRNSDRFQ